LPWPSTICAPPGGALFWATLAIVLPRIVTVLFGTIRRVPSRAKRRYHG
jgi:hypothetical protein